MKISIFLLTFFLTVQIATAQFLGDSKFRIYEGGAAGADVTLKIEKDGNYTMNISQLHCSLCDYEELTNNINRSGTWRESNDTLTIFESNKFWQFSVLNHRELKPLFLLDKRMYDIEMDSIQLRLEKIIETTKLGDFHLIYDTYESGMVKTTFSWWYFASDLYALHGPVIYYRNSGMLQKIEYYKKGKLKKTNHFN